MSHLKGCVILQVLLSQLIHLILGFAAELWLIFMMTSWMVMKSDQLETNWPTWRILSKFLISLKLKLTSSQIRNFHVKRIHRREPKKSAALNQAKHFNKYTMQYNTIWILGGLEGFSESAGGGGRMCDAFENNFWPVPRLSKIWEVYQKLQTKVWTTRQAL